MSNSDSESSERTVNPYREDNIIRPFLRYWYILAIGEEEFSKQRKPPPSQETYTHDDVQLAYTKFQAALQGTSWLSDFIDSVNASAGQITLDKTTVSYPDIVLLIIAEDLKFTWAELERSVFDHANFSKGKMEQLKDNYRHMVANAARMRKQMREDQFRAFMGSGCGEGAS